MAKTSTAVKNKYNDKTYDQVRLLVKKGQKDILKARAEANGESLNGYLNRLIAEDLSKTNQL